MMRQNGMPAKRPILLFLIVIWRGPLIGGLLVWGTFFLPIIVLELLHHGLPQRPLDMLGGYALFSLIIVFSSYKLGGLHALVAATLAALRLRARSALNRIDMLAIGLTSGVLGSPLSQLVLYRQLPMFDQRIWQSVAFFTAVSLASSLICWYLLRRWGVLPKKKEGA